MSTCRILRITRFQIVIAKMPQFVYTMKGLGKVHPPDLKVLEDIWLSFLPGAKIGVLGLNGAGKSSLLRIMAGDDHEVNAKLGEDLSPAAMDKVMDEQSRIQDRIEAANAWDLDARLDLAMDAL